MSLFVDCPQAGLNSRWVGYQLAASPSYGSFVLDRGGFLPEVAP